MKIKAPLLAATAIVMFAVPALANGPVVTKPTTTHHEWFFDKLDTNHDGVISKQEWLNDASKKFDAADTNHDGKLSKTEFAALGEHMHHGMHKEQYHWSSARVNTGGSTSTPPAHNEVKPNDAHPGGADGAGGWTAQ